METNSKTKYRIDVTMEQARTTLSVALLCDALDALGFRNQSPRLDFKPITCRAGDTPRMLMGLCKTTLWADMAHVDPTPYELELEAVDSCKAD